MFSDNGGPDYRDSQIRRLDGLVEEQRRTIGALMMGCEDMGGTTPVLRKIASLEADAERYRLMVNSAIQDGPSGPVINAICDAIYDAYAANKETFDMRFDEAMDLSKTNGHLTADKGSQDDRQAE